MNYLQTAQARFAGKQPADNWKNLGLWWKYWVGQEAKNNLFNAHLNILIMFFCAKEALKFFNLQKALPRIRATVLAEWSSLCICCKMDNNWKNFKNCFPCDQLEFEHFKNQKWHNKIWTRSMIIKKIKSVLGAHSFSVGRCWIEQKICWPVYIEHT